MSPTNEAGPENSTGAASPRPVSATSTALAVGGVIALVALGVLVGSVWDRGDDSANGSVPVDDIGDARRTAWVVVNDGSAPRRCRAPCGSSSGRRPGGRRDRLQRRARPASVEDSVLVDRAPDVDPDGV